MIDQYWHTKGIFGLIFRAALRAFQFVLAVTIAGLYGVDLAHATKTKQHAQASWIYAELVAALSSITCIIHCSVTVTRVAWSAWDGVLFVLWLAQVGVFGSAYASSVEKDYANATLSITRMRAAVWLDLISMFLWFATTVLGVTWCIRTRKVTRRINQIEPSQEELEAPRLKKLDNSDEEKGLPTYEKAILEGLASEKDRNSTNVKVQPRATGNEKGEK